MKTTLKGLRVHVEGMGLTGSLLAYHLERLGAEWTWHDNDAGMTAWKACTGAIYPAGKPGSLDDTCYRVWNRWLDDGVVVDQKGGIWTGESERPYPTQFFETANYCFNTKAPPHSGKYPFHRERKGPALAHVPSYHLNAQKFVPATRARFKSRCSTAPGEHVYIVAHGFGARLHHVVWGWTVPVKLSYTVPYGVVRRPAFYFREGRFVMAYAYPIPGTEFWYAGSSLIPQQRLPHELEVPDKFDRWFATFMRLGKGAVRGVRVMGAPIQGWRPAEGDAHVDPRVTRRVRRYSGRSVPELSVPPLWHSGIRHFPRVWQQLQAELLKIKEER